MGEDALVAREVTVSLARRVFCVFRPLTGRGLFGDTGEGY